MLCELAAHHAPNHPLLLWLLLSTTGIVSILCLSGLVFIESYGNARYERWSWKTNPRYPSVVLVRQEILASCKGVLVATLPPTLSLFLAQRNIGHAYCGTHHNVYQQAQEAHEEGQSFSKLFFLDGWPYLVLSFLVCWTVSDFYEWGYHRLGHTTTSGWTVHKHHHAFYNPTPFAVIADEPLDQFMRALPLLAFPLVLPTNMDMLFGMYIFFFYIYGIYLHWGHESEWLDAHHPWINTSFQHYIHHASSVKNKPYHTGFFFKSWDVLAQSEWDMSNDKTCLCVKCARARGERSREAWEKVTVPKYMDLFNWRLWVFGEVEEKRVD